MSLQLRMKSDGREKMQVEGACQSAEAKNSTGEKADPMRAVGFLSGFCSGFSRAAFAGAFLAADRGWCRLRFAVDAERRANFAFDPGGEFRVFAQRVLGVFAALTEPLALVRKPRARFFDNPVGDAEVNDFTHARDAFAIHNVELGFSERRRDLVLRDLDLRAIADNLFAVLDLSGAADVNAH